MKKFILLTVILFISFNAQAYAQSYIPDLGGLLKDYIKPTTVNGITYNGVNYDAWGKDPRHANVRKALLSVNPSTLNSKNEKLTYWINTYNFLTIDLIISEGERETIKNLGTIFNSPWKKYKWTIEGIEYSLDKIEHDIIRKMSEPRIHFAINCAAISCPDLRAEAYRVDKLNAQLDEQTRLTLNNSTKGFKVEDNNSVLVSKVIDWFKEDFENGNLTKWLQKYKADSINADTNIKFYQYDWSLNKQ